MSKDVWSWAINHQKDEGYWISLHKHSWWSETKSTFGGWLLNHAWFKWQYILANRIIFAAEHDNEDVLTLPITEEQARVAGWDI